LTLDDTNKEHDHGKKKEQVYKSAEDMEPDKSDGPEDK
jgi:hypothetical protein